MPECSHPNILFLVPLLFVALLNLIPTYLLNSSLFAFYAIKLEILASGNFDELGKPE